MEQKNRPLVPARLPSVIIIVVEVNSMEIYEYGDKSSGIVLIQPVDEHSLSTLENELALIRSGIEGNIKGEAGSDKGILLAAIKVNNWNNDLSPWKAPAVFGKENFGGGAAETLHKIIRYCQDSSKAYYVGGYSLAGLFALWAVYQTDIFEGVCAASPSMWFPGFIDYMKENEIKCGDIYLSLGDKEEKAKNPVMATVGDCIRTAEKMLKEKERNCILEWNEGNHFKDPDIRTAKGFAWLLNHTRKKYRKYVDNNLNPNKL